MKLYLDFDNTIVNTGETIVAMLNRQYGTNQKWSNIKRYDFKDLFPNLDKKELCEIFEGSRLYHNVSFLPGARDVLKSVRTSFEIKIVTIGGEENKYYKSRWLALNLPVKYSLTVLNNEVDNFDKSSVDMSDGIFIDDSSECLRSSNAKVKILLTNGLETEWNRRENDNFYVVQDWYEIGDILKFYVEKGEIV